MSEDTKELKKKQYIAKYKIKMAFFESITPELEKLAYVNSYGSLLSKWLKYSTLIWFLISIVSIVTPFLHLPLLNFDPTKTGDIAKSILAPSVTIIGLLVSFSPVVGFFSVTEMKENRKESKQLIKEDIENLNEKDIDEESRESDLQTLNKMNKLFETIWVNLQSGVLNYIATFIVVAIIMLILVIVGYIVFNSVQFILFDLSLLLTIIAGIIPIIQSGLIKSKLEPKPENNNFFEKKQNKDKS